MGLGALGIAGGIGRGITAGMKDRAAQREADQIAQVRQAQLDELTRQQQMRAEEANAVGDINSDAQSRVSASKSRAAGIANSVAQGNADAAMAEDIGNAVKAGAEQGSGLAQSLLASQPPTDSITPGAAPPPAATGIAAGADRAAASRTADLANTDPRQSPAGPAGATPLSPEQAYTQVWAERAPKIAAIHQKYGDYAGADAILKSSDSRELAMYDRQLTSAMRDYHSGNFDSAAAKLGTLYNLSYPDGKYADVQSVGGGRFRVTQYDEDSGKQVSTGVFGPDQIENLMQTTLSTAERAKLMAQDKISQRAADTQAAITNRYLVGEKGRNDRVATTEAGKNDRAANSEAGKNDRTDKIVGARADASSTNADATAAKNDAKNAETLGKEVDKYAGKDADMRALLVQRGSAYLGGGSTPAEAAAKAKSDYDDAKREATIAVSDDPVIKDASGRLLTNSHLGLQGTNDVLREKGDKEVVAALGTRLSATTYRDALIKKKTREALAPSAAKAAPAAAPAAAVTPPAAARLQRAKPLPSDRKQWQVGQPYISPRDGSVGIFNGNGFDAVK